MKRKNRNTQLQRSLLATALLGCMALTNAAYAQSASSTVRGTVSGSEAGTVVTATNTADGSVRRTTTGANGSYTLLGLAPGTYRVEAGPGTAQTVRVTVASSATLNLAAGGGDAPAGGGAVTDLATVSVTAPALEEVNTSEVGQNISLRQIQTVPQASRNFLEFADAVPGMVFERDPTGRTSLKGGAQNTSSTNLYIDGVGQKSYVKKGGVAGQFDSAGNPFPQLAIGEYKVITSNYKAEYGQISSAAVTAVTKSGTNELAGEVFYRFTDEGLREATPAEEAGSGKPKTSETEYGFALGGPIIEDRLHYFFTLEKKTFALPTAVVPGAEGVGLVSSLPPDVRGVFGPTVQPFDETLYFAKLDWDITDRDHVALSAQRRDEETVGNVGNQTAYSSGIYTDNYDHRLNLRWEHSADRWLNEVLATREESFNNPVPLNYGNGFIYNTPNGGNDPTIVRVGAADPRAGQVKGQKGWSIEDNFTFTGFDGHTIKAGARFKSIDLSAADALNANPQFLYIYGSPTFTNAQPYQAVFAKPVTGLGGLTPTVETTSKQYGVYFQDDWQVNEHLMLNLGLRWDYEEVPSYLDFVTPANVVAAFDSPNPDPAAPAGQTYRQALLAGGLDINDYISNGNNRKAFKDAWQPRLGFSYDIGADERHVIHGGAGRSYDRNLYDFLQLEQTKSALPQREVNFRDPVTGLCYRDRGNCFDWNPIYLNGIENLQALVAASNAGVEVDLMNNDLKTPYSDQFSLGMSNQLGDWLTDATVTHIKSHDGFAFTLGNRYPNGDFFQNGGQPWGRDVPGFGALIIGNNGIETESTQLLLSATKAYRKSDGWGATFAYTFTDAEQNRDINEHYSFDYASLSDYPVLPSNSVPRHRFVATGSLDGFWGITFGGKLVVATPTPIYSGTCIPGDQTAPVGRPNCMPAATDPDGTFGYRSLDLQATKEFDVDGVRFYGRIDLLNAFDWNNYTNVIVQDNRNGTISAQYNNVGNITGVPRTIKFELGMRF